MSRTKVTSSLISEILAKNSNTPRFLEDRFNDITFVKDYGVVGDGVTDDTLAIQLAINNLSSNNVLDLQNLNCLVTSSLVAETNDWTIQNGTLNFSSVETPGTVFTIGSTLLSAIALAEDVEEGSTFIKLISTDSIQKDQYIFIQSNAIWDAGGTNTTKGEVIQVKEIGETFAQQSSSVTLTYDLTANYIENLSAVSLQPELYTIDDNENGTATITFLLLLGTATGITLYKGLLDSYKISENAEILWNPDYISNVNFDNVTFVGANSAINLTALHFLNTQNININNCKFSYFYDNNINLEKVVKFNINNCTFNNTGNSNLLNSGIVCYSNTTYGNITNCHSSNIPNLVLISGGAGVNRFINVQNCIGVNSGFTFLSPSEYCTIVNCKSIDSPRDGFWLRGSNCTVKDCYAINANRFGINLNPSVVIKKQNIVAANSCQVVNSKNSAYNTQTDVPGVSAEIELTNSTGSSISGSFIELKALGFESSVNRALLTDNRTTAPITNTEAFGLYIVTNATGAKIDNINVNNNYIETANNNPNIFVNEIAGDVKNIRLTKNILHSNGFTLSSLGTFNGQIQDNIFLSPVDETFSLDNNVNVWASRNQTTKETFKLLAQTTTPTVGAHTLFKTNNVTAQTFNNFIGALPGQQITILVEDNNTIFNFETGNLRGNNGVNYTASTEDLVNAVYDGTNWRCVIGQS
jgi:hypothetical protein